MKRRLPVYQTLEYSNPFRIAVGAEHCGVLVWQASGVLSHPQGHTWKERQQESAVRNDRNFLEKR